jgi:hypothetical protein
MATLQELVADIIKELTMLQNSANPPIDIDDNFPLPRLIPTGDGGSIFVSKKIDQLISTVALQLNDSSLAASFTNSDLNETVRKAFGVSLARIDLDSEVTENADNVLSEVKAILIRQVLSHGPREYAFGCTLFGNSDVAAFIIGPVRFESRLDWLERKGSEKAISKVTQRRVMHAWQGRTLSKRKTSYDAIHERDILDVVGACEYICSVSTAGFADEAGREKALMAARLALAAIALLWKTPSKTLDGFNLSFDRKVHRQKELTFVPGKTVLAGSKLSHLPHGPSLQPGEWEKELLANSTYFAVASEILEYCLSPTGKVRRPNMMSTLAQSLMWFHEGCRESVTLMGIVKFSASMDALALGKKASGIRRVINARLKIKDEAPIRPEGPTMKQVIDPAIPGG